MRHDPIKVAYDGLAPSRGGTRRPRRPATRRPTPLDLGIDVVVTEDQGERLAGEVLDPERTEPIVCLSTRAGEDRPALDPRTVRKLVGREVLLRAVRTGPISRLVSTLLPPQMGVFGGAVRIWWPGVDDASDPSAHPLILDRTGRYGSRAIEALRERFAEGPPVRPEFHGAARLIALPGGGDRPVHHRTEREHLPLTPSEDQQLLLGALEAAREEIRVLREKLAEARLDAVRPR